MSKKNRLLFGFFKPTGPCTAFIRPLFGSGRTRPVLVWCKRRLYSRT